MSLIVEGNTYALLFLIMGAVWGDFLLGLGVPKTGAANVGIATIFAALLIVIAGVVLEQLKDRKESDSE